jgi:cytidine deaminase
MATEVCRSRVIRFHERHHRSVADGTKCSTLRWNEPVEVGSVVLEFEGRPRSDAIAGEVISVERFPLATITAAQARQPEGTDMIECGRDLRENYYPGMPDDADVDVVVFCTLA